jgi:hypothetical protein
MPNLSLIARPLPCTVYAQSPSIAEFNGPNAINNRYGLVAKRNTATLNSTMRIDIDLGASTTFDVVGVLWTNLREGVDRMHITCSDDPTFATQTTILSTQAWTYGGSSILRKLNKFVYKLPTPVTARYVRFFPTILGTGHPDGFIQMGRIFAGKCLNLSVGPRSVAFEVVDPGDVATSDLGDEVAEEGGRIVPLVKLNYEWVSETEYRTDLREFALRVGNTTPIILVPDMTDVRLQDALCFGRITRTGSYESELYDVWKASFQVKSIGP